MQSPSKLWLIFSLVIGFLSAVASLSGLFISSTYSEESINWVLQAKGQDIGNLIAIPILLFGVYSATQKSLKGFFIWLGALMYFIYAYLVYSFAVHFNFLFLIYVSILGLSIYSLIGLVVAVDSKKISTLIKSKSRLAPFTLIIIGFLFGILWLIEVIPSVIRNQPPASLQEIGLWVNPIHVIDLSTVLPGMILAGFLFLKRNVYGIMFIAPWLAFSVLMGTSIVVTMVIMFLSGDSKAIVPLVMTGIIVLISLISLATFLRGADSTVQ